MARLMELGRLCPRLAGARGGNAMHPAMLVILLFTRRQGGLHSSQGGY